MKKIILIILLLFPVLTNSQWVLFSSGIGNQYIVSLITNGNNIYAGTYSNGLYMSTNNGLNWTQTSLTGIGCSSMSINGSNFFVGTDYNPGVYLSTNSGINWSQTSLNVQLVRGLIVNGTNIFAGTISGMYKSTNNGTNWVQTGINNLPINTLLLRGNNIFAGADYSGVYQSTNNGSNWTQSGLSSRYVSSIIVKGNIIFAGTRDAAFAYGIYSSTNNGSNWMQTSLNNRWVSSLTVNGNTIIAGATAGVPELFISIDDGASWMLRNEGLNNFINSLCILNNYIYAGTNSGVYRRPLYELTQLIPTAPILIIPANNSSVQSTSLNLVWYKELDASSYRVQLGTDSLFSNLLINDSTITDTVKSVTGLLNNTLYYWKVNAKNPVGTSSYSTIWRFTTAVLPAAPVLISPPNNSFGISTTPKLDWTSEPSALSYRVQVSSDSTFASSQLDSVTTVDSIFIPSGRLNNNTRYFWHVRSQNNIGNSAYTAYFVFTTSLVGLTNNSEIPKVFRLYNNYPNPFNPTTKIRFAIPFSNKGLQPLVILKLYDALGREVETIVNEQLIAGTYEADWNASNYPSGVYFYKLSAGDYTATRKMVLIK